MHFSEIGTGNLRKKRRRRKKIGTDINVIEAQMIRLEKFPHCKLFNSQKSFNFFRCFFLYVYGTYVMYKTK